MNKGIIAGHLGADPETRYTANGKKVTNLRVGCKSRRGKQQDETIWWRVVIWGESFDGMIAHLKKGSGIFVMGDIHKPETYTSKDGSTQVSCEITADSISFSPFGKPNNGGAEGQRASGGFGEQTFDEGAAFGMASGKASASLFEHEEESVPF